MSIITFQGTNCIAEMTVTQEILLLTILMFFIIGIVTSFNYLEKELKNK